MTAFSIPTPLDSLTKAERADLRRQIELRERLLCRGGLQRDERMTIRAEYIELRNLEEAYV